MATIHISEADAARDFTELMARVRAGADIVIENGTLPIAVIHMPVPQHALFLNASHLPKSMKKRPERLLLSTLTSPQLLRRSSAIASPGTLPRGTDT